MPEDNEKRGSKAVAEPVTGTDVVTVALKHPTGIILEAFREVEVQEPIPGGGFRSVKLMRSTGDQFTLNGTDVPIGVQRDCQVINGYALTHGIPKEVWEVWKKQHHDSDLLKRGLIMAFAREDYVRDATKENKSSRSGLEPIRPDSDERIPKRRNREGKFVNAVETMR